MMASKNLPIIDWTQIEASAPGKFIISGEYSVVYEKQAIAATIDLRTRVIIRPNKEERVRLNLKNFNNVREWPITSLTMCKLVSKYSECLNYHETMSVKLNNLLHPRYQDNSSPQVKSEKDDVAKTIQKKADDAAMSFLLLYIGLGDSYASSAKPSIDVEVDSSIPVGSGLGSSSALSVALCSALMKVYRVSAEKYIISNWALNIDKFFHGKPSGVDNSVVTNGGYILFQNGKIKATGCAHKNPIKVMLIDTGVSRSTRELSEKVLAQLTEDPGTIKNTFNNIHELTARIWNKMNDPNFVVANIALFLRANQELLDALGVGHPKLQDIISRAARLDLTAKQTGAGGGGNAFVLYNQEDDNESINQLRSELVDAGYRVSDHTVGEEEISVSIIPDESKQIPPAGGDQSYRYQ